MQSHSWLIQSGRAWGSHTALTLCSSYNLTVHFLSHDSKRSRIILLWRGRNLRGRNPMKRKKLRERSNLWWELNVQEWWLYSGSRHIRTAWKGTGMFPVASTGLDADKGGIQICVRSWTRQRTKGRQRQTNQKLNIRSSERRTETLRAFLTINDQNIHTQFQLSAQDFWNSMWMDGWMDGYPACNLGCIYQELPLMYSVPKGSQYFDYHPAPEKFALCGYSVVWMEGKIGI